MAILFIIEHMTSQRIIVSPYPLHIHTYLHICYHTHHSHLAMADVEMRHAKGMARNT